MSEAIIDEDGRRRRPVWGESSHALIEFVRFIAIGGLAALVNLISRYLLDFVMPFEAAVVLAYMVGMVFAFFLFQKLIFGGSGGLKSRRVIRFVQVNLLGAGLAWAVSSLMARVVLPALGWDFHPFEVAHFVGVAAPAISSYFLHKHYTFA
jgi:putative flippase GtrA